ncbi:Cilia- and flagella-associated protein 73 [Physocladia obscura]|uniref:Cilia- and flagella-associated protein 73 n=1 Tax=Physocladia obscura TaxID=109957 RepID=A0AAD5XHQ5_9FUNG|nr:Cilia- and flagella-associated protein 73 [Physocladia obscura]
MTSSIEDYFRANVENKLFIKVPEQEDHDLTPATRLLEKRREMLEVENGLTQQKEEFAMKMEALKQRSEELAKKEAQLKESLLKFDKFLKENDAKRNRATKKAIDERKARDQKEGEIQDLKKQMVSQSVKKDRSGQAVDTFLETTEEFGEVKDIISRFDTLAATNQELIDRAREAQEKTERNRSLLINSTEEKNTLILNYNNDIAKLQTRLEEAQMRSAKCQLEWDQTLKNATSKTLELGQIKMAVNNLFLIVKTHLNSKITNTVDTKIQLDKIQQFMLDLNAITTELTQG